VRGSVASRVWHPFTQHGLGDAEILIDRGEGALLYTADGRAIIDAIASWWVNTHGHGHPRIAQAIAVQAARLEQVIFAGFTHAPAETLTDKLLALVPAGLEYVFFSDSGSTAVEVAVKMAVGCWHHRGERRTRLVAIEDGYHGDTFGAMACGARGLFTEPYWPMLFTVDHLPFPAPGCEQASLDAFAAILARHGGAVAALILEPLVLGAGGMRMYPPWVLTELAGLCRAHGVFLIADEVMTGFGRTGTLFACEQAAVSPDLMCLSKGLTGGFLAMGVTLARAEIFEAFRAADRARMFFHSSSYTGSPLACAAALASLQIWKDEPVRERIAAIAAYHARRIGELKRHPVLADARQCGTIAAFELRADQGGYLAAVGPALYRFFLGRGVLLRPLGNVIYVLPPYCITRDQLDAVYDVIGEALDRVLHGHGFDPGAN
jgi:adenosylmethionine-8-amino-7-oxononanoate aminotransferase